MSPVDRAAWFLRRCTPARVTLYLLIYVSIALTVLLVMHAGGVR